MDAVEVAAPAADGTLSVRLPEPLDRALLQRFLRVEDAVGARVPGTSAVDGTDTVWTFRPDAPWRSGAYAVRIESALEDRAGNRFDRPFDRVEGTETPPSRALRVPFAVP